MHIARAEASLRPVNGTGSSLLRLSRRDMFWLTTVLLPSCQVTERCHITLHTPDMPLTWHTAHDTEESDHIHIHRDIGRDGQDMVAMKTVMQWDMFRASLLREPGYSAVTLQHLPQQA